MNGIVSVGNIEISPRRSSVHIAESYRQTVLWLERANLKLSRRDKRVDRGAKLSKQNKKISPVEDRGRVREHRSDSNVDTKKLLGNQINTRVSCWHGN